MKNKSKNFIFYLIMFLFFGLYVEASRELETRYPGATFNTTVTPIGVYINYIFSFVVSIIGIIVFISITMGGFKYIYSANNPEEVNKAKSQIYSSILGLLIILFSWIILNEINPNFVGLENPQTSPIPIIMTRFKDGGVLESPILICNEEIEDMDLILDDNTNNQTILEIKRNIDYHCLSLKEVGLIDSRWREPEIIYIFPGFNVHYGAIFRTDYQRGQIVYNLTDQIKEIKPMAESIYFAYPFNTMKERDNSYFNYIREVQLFKFLGMDDNPQNLKTNDPDYDFLYGPYDTSTNPLVSSSTDLSNIIYTEGLPIKKITLNNASSSEKELRIKSMKLSSKCIDSISSEVECSNLSEKPTIVFFDNCEDANWDEGESCEIAFLTSGNYNLIETEVNNLCLYPNNYPCAQNMIIISGHFGI